MSKKKDNSSICKTSRRERRVKLSRFKDKLHGMFGSPSSKGIGEGKPNICDLCGKRVHKTIGIYIESLRKFIYQCDKCRS